MDSILPPATDNQADGHHMCPRCGQRAKSIVTRETATGTLNTDCLGACGHIWSVHWMAA